MVVQLSAVGRAGAPRRNAPGAWTGYPSAAWRGLPADLLDRFADVLAVEHRFSAATRSQHRSQLLRFDRWLRQSARHTLANASSANIVRYLRELAADVEHGAAAPSSVARSHRALRRFYGWLRGIGFRDDDPVRGAPVKAWWTGYAGRAHHLEHNRLMRAALLARNRTMFALMLSVGARVKDLALLQLSDLNLDECWLSLGESQAAATRVPLQPALVRLLHSYLDGSRRSILDGRNSTHLFPSRTAGRLTRAACSRAVMRFTGAS